MFSIGFNTSPCRWAIFHVSGYRLPYTDLPVSEDVVFSRPPYVERMPIMFSEASNPGLEADFLNERLAELFLTYPAVVFITRGVWDALDHQKTVVQGELRVRSIVLALGIHLALRSTGSLERLHGWLNQFFKGRVLSTDQAMQFIRQTRALEL